MEILIIDDGSTDDTPEIADQYARLYPETVKAVHKSQRRLRPGGECRLSWPAANILK